MKRILSSLTLATLLVTSGFTLTLFASDARKSTAQTDLSYKFYNQRIRLVEKPNQVAVVFKPSDGSRSLEPNLLKLQKVLQGGGGSRNFGAPENLNVDVKPLGLRYAVLTLPATRSLNYQQVLKQRLDQTFIQTTLPVFQPQNAPKDSDQTIILHDEIIVSVEPGTSQSAMNLILKRFDVEMVRPLRFSKNRYLVRSRTESGKGLLAVIEQLNNVTGIQSASPNLIQAANYQPAQQSLATATEEQTAIDPQQIIASLPRFKNSPYPDSLLPYQWHLDSRFRKTTPGQRTDVRALEAWAKGDRGKGVLVAVIDSAIQWDHPDLQKSVYQVPQNLPDLLPGERYGWDFSGFEKQQTCVANNPNSCVPGDPDTRLSSAELAALKPHFQRMFQRDDAVLKNYEELADAIRRNYPQWSSARVADLIRQIVLGEVSSEFHGTWVAGVVAANPQAPGGVVGVAPNAKVLPVRVFGLGGEISGDALIESIGYAAARGADVINLSLGSLLPTQAEADQIFAVLDEHPKLVMVASSGNEDVDGAGYPAAVPGVLSVGASNLAGQRSFYSNFGRRLDLMAPGGDTSLNQNGGILTTGGTWISGFWTGMTIPNYTWGPAFDPLGKYVQVQGTSFSSPVVAGVVALMKGEDPQRRLTREQLKQILWQTASYQPLKITQKDANRYRLQQGIPSTQAFIPMIGLVPISSPGIDKPGEKLPIEQYYFGRGLVNAAAAVDAVKQQVTTTTNKKR